MSEFASPDLSFEPDGSLPIITGLLQEANFETVFEPETAAEIRGRFSYLHEKLLDRGQSQEAVLQCYFPENPGARHPQDRVIAVRYLIAETSSGINLTDAISLWETRSMIDTVRHMVYPGLFALNAPENNYNWPAIGRAATLEELFRASPDFS